MSSRTWRLRAIAISAAPMAIFGLVVIATAGIPVGQTLSLVSDYILLAAAVWCVVVIGPLLTVTARPLLKRTFSDSPLLLVRRAVQRRWTDDYFLSLVWPMLLFGLLFGFLAVFKQTVLRRHGFADDALFASWDKALFFGIQPWRLTHALPAPWTTLALGRVYAFWYVPVIGALLPCAFRRGSLELRTRYLLAFVGCWTLIGGLLAYLLPSAGPCFAEAFHPGMTEYRPLLAALQGDNLQLARTAPGVHTYALATQDYLLRLHQTGSLGFGGGISAMPSMHVTQATLIAAGAFAVGRRLGWIATVYAAVVYVGSIHLGWHYAIDGIVGGASALVVWTLAGVVTRALLRPRTLGLRRDDAPSVDP